MQSWWDQIDQNRCSWTTLISDFLAAIDASDGMEGNEGSTPPSNTAMKVARYLAEQGCLNGWPPPQRITSNGEGGILFERGDGDDFETLEVLSHGVVELACFRNAQLYGRRRLPRPGVVG